MQMLMLLTMRADELRVPRRGGRLCGQLGWIGEMTAGALDDLEIGRVGFEPLGQQLGQHTTTVAEGTHRMKTLKDGIPDERRLVRQFIEDLGQVLIHTKRHDGLLLLFCHDYCPLHRPGRDKIRFPMLFPVIMVYIVNRLKRETPAPGFVCRRWCRRGD